MSHECHLCILCAVIQGRSTNIQTKNDHGSNSIPLAGQGLKSWGYDTENPLKELRIPDRKFMAITKLQLMGHLIKI